MRLLAGTQLQAAETVDDETMQWSSVTSGEWLTRNSAADSRPEWHRRLRSRRKLNATLRPYQADGVRWLWFMTQLGLGACLADDMGLGKTIQVIDLILQLEGCRSAARGVGKETAERSRRSRNGSVSAHRACFADRKLEAGTRQIRTAAESVSGSSIGM